MEDDAWQVHSCSSPVSSAPKPLRWNEDLRVGSDGRSPAASASPRAQRIETIHALQSRAACVEFKKRERETYINLNYKTIPYIKLKREGVNLGHVFFADLLYFFRVY